MVYLIDTSAILDAKKRYYSFGRQRPFWLWLTRQIHIGKVVVIEQVYDEIAVGNDELAKWIRSFAKQARSVPSSHSRHMAKMKAWIRANYRGNALQGFTEGGSEKMESADASLISHALHQKEHDLHGLEEHVVVTQEISAFASNTVKIPDVCRRFGVRCITLSEMLAEQGVDFAQDIN